MRAGAELSPNSINSGPSVPRRRNRASRFPKRLQILELNFRDLQDRWRFDAIRSATAIGEATESTRQDGCCLE